MAKITYIDKQGVSHTHDVAPGLSVMEGAVNNGISGILAECGGCCACGTCQVLVEGGYVERLPTKGPLEQSMLDAEHDDVPHNLRLSCQLPVTEELDGLVVRVPEKLS